MTRANTYDDYLTLDLTKCKALGYFVPNATAEGVITWHRGSTKVAAVRLRTDTVNNKVYLAYNTTNGEERQQAIWLRWQSSNLNIEGYYYFVCPVTGRSCRKLYFVDGRFISRFAFKALYEAQTRSHAQRKSIWRFLASVSELENLAEQPHRKRTYKGKLTPYARKVQKIDAALMEWHDKLKIDALCAS